MDDQTVLKRAWSLLRQLFKFWKISDNNLKTVQDSTHSYRLKEPIL